MHFLQVFFRTGINLWKYGTWNMKKHVSNKSCYSCNICGNVCFKVWFLQQIQRLRQPLLNYSQREVLKKWVSWVKIISEIGTNLQQCFQVIICNTIFFFPIIKQSSIRKQFSLVENPVTSLLPQRELEIFEKATVLNIVK